MELSPGDDGPRNSSATQLLWALGEDKARNQIFNVSNGDVYPLATTVE